MIGGLRVSVVVKLLLGVSGSAPRDYYGDRTGPCHRYRYLEASRGARGRTVGINLGHACGMATRRRTERLRTLVPRGYGPDSIS